MNDYIGFEVGKYYRVKPECYDDFSFVCWWDGKDNSELFCAEYVCNLDGSVICDDRVVATSDEFKYCEEVSESGDSNQNKLTEKLDYSKCLYASPEYLWYYVSFIHDGVRNFTHINEPEIDKTGKNLIFLNDDGMFEFVPLGNLKFYQEDGSECSFDEIT